MDVVRQAAYLSKHYEMACLLGGRYGAHRVLTLRSFLNHNALRNSTKLALQGVLSNSNFDCSTLGPGSLHGQSVDQPSLDEQAAS
jgi:hypothetical protein